VLEAPLRARVVAPSGVLQLGIDGHTTYQGQFFASKVVLRPDTTVEAP
jgi:hypothetical protein